MTERNGTGRVTPFMANPEWLPSIELLEESAAIVIRETEKLLERARQEKRRVQDIEAELDGLDPEHDAARYANGYGVLQAARHSAAHRLRWIARHFGMAQAQLVSPTDERFGAARQVIGWLEDGERSDAPWRDEQAVA